MVGTARASDCVSHRIWVRSTIRGFGLYESNWKSHSSLLGARTSRPHSAREHARLRHSVADFSRFALSADVDVRAPSDAGLVNSKGESTSPQKQELLTQRALCAGSTAYAGGTDFITRARP